MRYGIVILVAGLLVACSSYQANDSDRGAVAGAVVGGGLGAIIGSQAGSTTGGLALGSVTGAGVGALIGNRFQGQNDTINSQAETINQQRQELQEHRNQIEELRRSSQDQVVFNHTRNTPVGSAPQVVEKDLTQMLQPTEPQAYTDMAIVETPEVVLNDSTITEDAAPQYVPAVQPIQEIDARAAFNPAPSVNQESPECQEATQEVASADQAQITAEKLYHFRRALRLCPQDADIHAGLGAVYLELQRTDDARFELQEALKLNPGHQQAQDLMKKL